MYRSVVFPVLKRLDPESAHHLAARGLEVAEWSAPGRAVLRRIAGEVPRDEVRFCGLTFRNCLGVAAGFDKDVRLAAGLGELGFGHVEVGTLTPRPQAGNPRPRIFRLPEHRALINRMGFPNAGVRAAVPRLRRLAEWKGDLIIGVSLGKQKETPLEDAHQDYIAVMRAVHAYSDYLAVNISSPNTPGLRELQGGQYLRNLLSRLVEENERLNRGAREQRVPMLVKIAPDLTDDELDEILETLQQSGIDGIVATNTTLSRAAVEASPVSKEAGGLSGRPLEKASTAMIRTIARKTEGRLPIIGAGGVLTARDVARKLRAGASLVQAYTGLVYRGPSMPGRVLRRLERG